MANSLLSQSFINFNFPQLVNDIFLASLSQRTKRLYIVYLKKWITYCVERGLDFKSPQVKTVIPFFTKLFQAGASYSAINVARSALSFCAPTVNSCKLGADPQVCRFLQGIRNLRPKLSRYVATWDTDIVLEFLYELWPHSNLSLDLLSKKLAVLFLMITSHRIQTLQVLKVSNIYWVTENELIFMLDEKLKHIRNKELGFLKVNAFTEEPRLCIVKCLKAYLEATKLLRGKVDYLFITTKKPARAAHHDTIAHWVTYVFKEAGVDIKSFKAHSIRSATTSKYLALRVPVDSILKKAQWSSESTFRRFYDKPILPKEDISQDLLNSFLKNNRK